MIICVKLEGFRKVSMESIFEFRLAIIMDKARPFLHEKSQQS